MARRYTGESTQGSKERIAQRRRNAPRLLPRLSPEGWCHKVGFFVRWVCSWEGVNL
jgi:hypothetical protein